MSKNSYVGKFITMLNVACGETTLISFPVDVQLKTGIFTTMPPMKVLVGRWVSSVSRSPPTAKRLGKGVRVNGDVKNLH